MQELKNESQIAYFLSYLATVSLAAGEPSLAIAQAREALEIRFRLNQPVKAAFDTATLAAAYRQAGQIERAVDFAHQTLAVLDRSPDEKSELSQRGYFICHQVLTVAGEEIPANMALKRAYALVNRRVKTINDPALRESFLRQVQINREIVAAAEQAGLT